MEIVMLLIVNVVIGIVICFYGKKLYFPIMMGSVFVASIAMCYKQFDSVNGIIIEIVLGVILALLSRFTYKLGLFLLGSLSGIMIGMMIFNLFPQFVNGYEGMVLLVCALGLGFCVIRWHDTFVKVLTAYNGASIISPSLCFLFMYITGIYDKHNLTVMNLNEYLNNQLMVENTFVILGITMILMIIGLRYQQKIRVSSKKA